MSERQYNFGFDADKDGNVNFITIQTEFNITCFPEYMEWFAALVQVAYDNPGYMPIVTFPDYPPPKIPEDLYPEDEEDG